MKRLGIIILLISLSVLLFLDLIDVISDPDFFWHIATGRWIVENRALPNTDPFSFTTPNFHTVREKFILTSYWLSQVIYYISYYMFDYMGIIFLRGIIAIFFLFFLFKRMSLKDIPPAIYLPLIFIIYLIMVMNYKWERPQAFSFLFFGILLYLIDELRIGKRYAVYVMPLLMLVWANMHGGFIVGQGVLFIYIFSEVLNRIIYKSKIDKLFIISSIISILIAFVNPNFYLAIKETLTGEANAIITQGIKEFMSTLEFFKSTGAMQIPLYWLILILGIFSLIHQNKKRSDIANIVIFLAFAYYSFFYVRYIAFFVIYAAPLIGSYLSSLRWKRVIEVSLLVISVAYFVLVGFRYDIMMNLKNINAFKDGNFISSYYPEKSVKFISANLPKKRIYNVYDWGGYLIWMLYPEKAVFIDGRQLHENAYILSQAIENAAVEPSISGIPYWKAILTAYNIDCIIIPAFRTLGDVLPLFSELLNDNEWVPVFYYQNSIVFVKRIPENYRIIYIYSIPKEMVINYMINFTNSVIQQNPYIIGFHIAKGDLLLIAGRYYEAEQAYKRALELFPLHSGASKRLEELKMIYKREGN